MLSGMQGLKILLAPMFWRFFERTVRIDAFPEDRISLAEPSIFVSLHRDLLPAIMFLKPTRLAIVISNSPDGDILVHTLGHDNYHFIRGATGQGGGRAFVGMRRMLEAGISVGIAVDGPEGPYGTIHNGALRLAQITGVPIRPVKAEPARAAVLKTWDRTVVPMPFSQVKMVSGDAIEVSSSGDFEEQRKLLVNFFQVGGEGS